MSYLCCLCFAFYLSGLILGWHSRGKHHMVSKKQRRWKRWRKRNSRPLGSDPPSPSQNNECENTDWVLYVGSVAPVPTYVEVNKNFDPDFLDEIQQLRCGCCEKVNIVKYGIIILLEVYVQLTLDWYKRSAEHLLRRQTSRNWWSFREQPHQLCHGHDGGEGQAEGDARGVASLRRRRGCWDRDEAA